MEEEERQRVRLTRDPNHTFLGALGSNSKPDLVDIAQALGIKQVTHPGKEKLTKKKIQDFIDVHFDSNPRMHKDARFEGLFNACRWLPCTDENTNGIDSNTSILPQAHSSTHLQLPNTLPLSSNVANVILPAPPVPGPSQESQPHLHSQFTSPPFFGPGPFTAPIPNAYFYPHPYYTHPSYSTG